MGVRARKIRADAAQDRAAEDDDGTVLHPRDVIETLEPGGYLDNDIDAARGLVNGAIIGAVVWTLILVTYYVVG